jgi:hypothetical protein
MEQHDLEQRLQQMESVPASPALLPAILARLGLEHKGASSLSTETLALALRDDRWQIRLSALRQARLLKGPGVDELLMAATHDEDEFIRLTAIHALQSRGNTIALSSAVMQERQTAQTLKEVGRQALRDISKSARRSVSREAAFCREDEDSFVALARQAVLVDDTTPAAARMGSSGAGMAITTHMRSVELAAQCLRELDNYRRGEPYTDAYGVELFRRATVQGDQDAWAWMQQCFSGLVRGWLLRHPHREAACRLESEENYVAQTFERFWQATTLMHSIEFRTMASALQYLRACLNGTIVDTLRAYSRPRQIPLPEPEEPGELQLEDDSESSKVWDILKTILPNRGEQRLAYLLYHCGLKPREIVRFCPQEFSDVHEIYRLRRNIMERLLRNADQLRWQLNQ